MLACLSTFLLHIFMLFLETLILSSFYVQLVVYANDRINLTLHPPSIQINMHRETTSIYLFLLSDILWELSLPNSFISTLHQAWKCSISNVFFIPFRFHNATPSYLAWCNIFWIVLLFTPSGFYLFTPLAKNVPCRNTKKGINQCVVNFYTVGKRLIINFRLVFFQFFLACF